MRALAALVAETARRWWRDPQSWYILACVWYVNLGESIAESDAAMIVVHLALAVCSFQAASLRTRTPR